jgi:hypothetical protein
MNYRNIIIDKLDEFKKDLPDYTFSQCLFAAIRHLDCYQNFTKSDLLSVTDEEMYTALEAALKVETHKDKVYE